MNNQVNLDPVTGQPVTTNSNNMANNQTIPQQPINNMPSIEQQPVMQQMPVANQTAAATTIQQQMNTIPTVDQDKNEFITNTQATNEIETQEKKKGPNIAFVVILFIIIFASIFFLFPYLLDVLG